jgi:hypothetical protein
MAKLPTSRHALHPVYGLPDLGTGDDSLPQDFIGTLGSIAIGAVQFQLPSGSAESVLGSL